MRAKNRLPVRWIRAFAFAIFCCSARIVLAQSSPQDLYAELFEDVQNARVFPDSKTFCDAVPKHEPAEILSAYRSARATPRFDLRAFVREHFTFAKVPETPPLRARELTDYIDRLWEKLVRPPDESARVAGSRIALPQRYVVPGGRFEELYYWDSYFTMLGLAASGRHDLAADMLRNFAWLIEHYGFIPNGTRTYYLSRSQPPFFALMVELVADHEGPSVFERYLPQLQREYAFWMAGAEGLAPQSGARHVVRLADGTLLNRYWDARDTPRDEAYREDVATARASGRPVREVYRNLRAAAESGWDFSSRWLADGKTLATIATTELVPPDLNSLLYQLERTIARGCSVKGDGACEREFLAKAERRKAAVQRVSWNVELGVFADYDFVRARHTARVSAATLYPLYFGIASDEQAQAVSRSVRAKLLEPHGLATTTARTGQQWDAPNGWAPLQWIAVRGLERYGEHELAAEIVRRWTSVNSAVFRRTGKLFEKYDVSRGRGGSGGEYTLQDGFGWTNGVLRRLLSSRK